MASMDKVVRSVFVSLGAVGSLFVKKTVDGKYEIAAAPFVLVIAVGSGVACAAQSDELFRVCIKNNMSMLQEIVNAN